MKANVFLFVILLGQLFSACNRCQESERLDCIHSGLIECTLDGVEQPPIDLSKRDWITVKEDTIALRFFSDSLTLQFAFRVEGNQTIPLDDIIQIRPYKNLEWRDVEYEIELRQFDFLDNCFGMQSSNFSYIDVKYPNIREHLICHIKITADFPGALFNEIIVDIDLDTTYETYVLSDC